MQLVRTHGVGTLGRTASLEITAGGHAARLLQPVAVAGLRTRSNERGDFLVTTMPVIDEAAPVSNGAKLLFPLVVNGGGYSTEFVGIQ